MKLQKENIIGLIPAAGRAVRLSHLPFSKELYPIGKQILENNIKGPRVAALHIIDAMKLAGIQNFYTVIREGKWDIPAYFENGHVFNLNMAYLIADKGYGVPYSLNQVYPFAKGKLVAMGFPDIIFKPVDAFSKLLDQMVNQPETDVLLGLFPVQNTEKWDMVETNEQNRLSAIHIKSKNASKEAMAWIIAIWSSRFSEFLNQFIDSYVNDNPNLEKNELQLSTVFLAARIAGYKIGAVKFENGYCIDIGTQEGIDNYFATFDTEN